MTCIAMPAAGLGFTPERWLSPEAPNNVDRWLEYRARDHSITRGFATTELLARVSDVASEASSADWDGEGARAVEPSTVNFAQLFIAYLPLGTPHPCVYAERDGDIGFHWDSGRRSVFSVSVRRDGVLNFAGLLGPKRFYGSDVIFSGISPEIVQFIKAVSGSEGTTGCVPHSTRVENGK